MVYTTEASRATSVHKTIEEDSRICRNQCSFNFVKFPYHIDYVAHRHLIVGLAMIHHHLKAFHGEVGLTEIQLEFYFGMNHLTSPYQVEKR